MGLHIVSERHSQWHVVSGALPLTAACDTDLTDDVVVVFAVLQVADVGGSMFVHAFGAYFGLAASRVLYREDVAKSEKEGSVYHSDIFSMIGWFCSTIHCRGWD